MLLVTTSMKLYLTDRYLRIRIAGLDARVACPYQRKKFLIHLLADLSVGIINELMRKNVMLIPQTRQTPSCLQSHSLTTLCIDYINEYRNLTSTNFQHFFSSVNEDFFLNHFSNSVEHQHFHCHYLLLYLHVVSISKWYIFC